MRLEKEEAEREVEEEYEIRSFLSSLERPIASSSSSPEDSVGDEENANDSTSDLSKSHYVHRENSIDRPKRLYRMK